jgi:hypothetical protein
VAGGEVRTIETGRGIYPSWVHDWTPDGRELLVVNTIELEDPGEVGLMNVQTGRFRSLGSVEPGASVSISPDGSGIVVSELARPDYTQRDIRVIDVAGGRSQSLLSGSADDYGARWAAGGHTIRLRTHLSVVHAAPRSLRTASRWRSCGDRVAAACVPDGKSPLFSPTMDSGSASMARLSQFEMSRSGSQMAAPCYSLCRLKARSGNPQVEPGGSRG